MLVSVFPCYVHSLVLAVDIVRVKLPNETRDGSEDPADFSEVREVLLISKCVRTLKVNLLSVQSRAEVKSDLERRPH